jgi:hypothetical protein
MGLYPLKKDKVKYHDVHLIGWIQHSFIFKLMENVIVEACNASPHFSP